ncbi:MAG: hypothetical protein A4E70_02645 [Syntrophus sp. PtaU1.Bin005]|nr:MAG: hypothetical protein A4E70_02645 [Syntrophus sp. PtaU1.Bin005]
MIVADEPFNVGIKLQLLLLVRLVRQGNKPEFAIVVDGDEIGDAGRYAVVFLRDRRIAEAVTALIGVRLDPERLICQRPYFCFFAGGTLFPGVNVASRPIEILVIRGPPQETIRAAIAVEAVSSGALGDNGAILVVRQVIDPGSRCFGMRDNKFEPVR